MEEEGLLNRSDDLHIYALHVCIGKLLEDCVSNFMDAWNCHPIRTENNFTPIQLFVKGLIELNDTEEDAPELIQVVSVFISK